MMSGTDTNMSRECYSEEAFVPGLEPGASGKRGEEKGWREVKVGEYLRALECRA